jgi:hypothetical protein
MPGWPGGQLLQSAVSEPTRSRQCQLPVSWGRSLPGQELKQANHRGRVPDLPGRDQPWYRRQGHPLSTPDSLASDRLADPLGILADEHDMLTIGWNLISGTSRTAR